VLTSESWLDCLWSLAGLVDAVGLVDFGKYGALIIDSMVRASLSKILDPIGFGIGDWICERDNGRPLAGEASSNLLLQMLPDIVRRFKKRPVTGSCAHGWSLS
jgi:hypothetical protein